MAANGWCHTGITEQILSDDSTTQQVKALVPTNGRSSRFVHLKVVTQ